MKFKLDQDIKIAGQLIKKGSVISVTSAYNTAYGDDVISAYTDYLIGNPDKALSELRKIKGRLEVPEDFDMAGFKGALEKVFYKFLK